MLSRLRTLFITLFADISILLLAIFVLREDGKSKLLAASELKAAGVPGMEEKITGLQGELDEANTALTQARDEGAELDSVLENQETRFGDLKNQLDLTSSENGDLKKKLGRLNTQNGQLTATVGELTGQLSTIQAHFRAGAPVTLVVLIDGTWSMEQLHADLRLSLSTLFEFMPNTSKDFRVGILLFRDGVIKEFPITQVLPIYEDKGHSQQAVLTFVDSFTAIRSHTDQLPVFQRAVQMIAAAHPQVDPTRKERILLLSDVGPSEADRIQGYSEAERKTKTRILSGMKKWAEHGNRGVAAIYAESQDSQQDPGAAESRQWFQKMGHVSPKSDFYTNANQALRAVLQASLN